MSHSSSDTPSFRRRAVAFALVMVENTQLAPGLYEQQLLEQYVAGQLTLDEILCRLEAAQATAATDARQ